MRLPFSFLLILLWPLLTLLLLAQENPENNSDLKSLMKEADEMQKEAAELRKTNPPAKSESTKKKMAEMQKQAEEEVARGEQEEKEEKAKLEAALKKQLNAPGRVALPDWTPATPQFIAKGAATKKIVNDEVRLVQSGTSTLTPRELLKAWKAAVADKPLNNTSNDITSNGSVTTRLFLSTRKEPEEKVRLDAFRDPGEKVTRVEMSYCLPKPDIESE
jgi:hypothetical protein